MGFLEGWRGEFERKKEAVMRRVLALLLVLGVVSSANALVVSMDPSGTGAHAVGNVPITVGSDTSDVSYTVYLVISDTTYGSFTSVIDLDDAGQDASVSNLGTLGGYDSAWSIEADGLDIVFGDHFIANINYTGTNASETCLVVLLNDSLTQLDSYLITPEPATVLLLGLGGLFLRKNHKN